MKALGRHILAEFFGCDSEILNDVGNGNILVMSVNCWRRSP